MRESDVESKAGNFVAFWHVGVSQYFPYIIPSKDPHSPYIIPICLLGSLGTPFIFEKLPCEKVNLIPSSVLEQLE